MAQSTISSTTGSRVPLLDLTARPNVPSMPIRSPPKPPGREAVPSAVSIENDQMHSECTFRHATVLLGAFSANLVSFGWILSSGLFFDYYRTQLFPDESEFAISWLNGVGFACFYAASLPLACYCSSSTFGPQPTICVGAFVDLLGLCLLSLASNLPEVLVLQAFVSPLGASMVFNASVTILSKWFRRNGIRAVSLTAAGSGVGGLCFPLLIHQLLAEIGHVRTILVCVIVHLTLLGICCVTLTMPHGVKHEPCRIKILDLFSKTQFLITTIGSAFYVCGYYTIMGFLVSIAHARGLHNPNLALSIASGSSIPGRLISGWIAQSRGPYNTLILFTLIAWVLTISLFPNFTTQNATFVFCGLWGFFSSACISLLPAIIFFQSPLPEVSTRIGFAYSMMSIMVLAGSPIGAAIVGATTGYNTLILFCGILQAAGWMCWVIARYYETGLPAVDIL